MKKIAVTGIIASGKSAVCEIIENLGGYVIYTDKINRELLCDKNYVAKLAKIFPLAVRDGVVARDVIRQEILADNAKRLALNSLAHTEIKHRVENIVSNFNGKTIFCEIPLIVESEMVNYFDQIWCVVAKNEVRVSRIMARDKVDKESAEKIIACQNNDKKLLEIADFVIENNGDLKILEEKVKSLYSNL